MSQPNKALPIRKVVVRTNYRPTTARNEPKSFLAKNAKMVSDNDPIPLILAAIGMALGGTMLETLIGSLAEGVLRPATSGIEFATRLMTYRIYKGWTLDTLVAGLKATIFTPDSGDGSYVNVDDNTLKEAMDKIAEGTIMATAMISEDAGEIVMEAFQEAFSNATYYGLGGMFATMTAYRAGFMPPQNPFQDPGMMLLDPITRANLDSLVGYNAYATTAQEALRYANQIMDSYGKSDKLDGLWRAFSAYGDLPLHMLSQIDRLYDTMIDYIVEHARTALSVLMRRVIDIRDTMRAAYADWLAKLIDDTQMRLILVDAQLELRQIRDLKTDILDDLDAVLSNIPAPSSDVLANLAAIIEAIENALDSYWKEQFDSMQQYLDTLKRARRLTRDRGMTWSYISSKSGNQYNYTWG